MDPEQRHGHPRACLPRPRRSPQSRRAVGVGDVEGEVMTTYPPSPTTDENAQFAGGSALISNHNVEVVRRLLGFGAELRAMLSPSTNLSDHPWLSLWHPECVIEEVAEVPD